MNKTDFKDNDSILVFEYYTASGISDPKIISEAIAMIDSLLNDLKGLNVHFLVSKKFIHIVEEHKYVTPIILNEDLKEWISCNIDNFSSCMFISSEEDMNLHNLTDLIEKKGVKLYGSTGFATAICSDKFTAYRHFKGVVNQPRTFKFTLNDESEWEIAIKNLLMFINSSNSVSEDSTLDGGINSSTSKNNNSNEDFKLISKPIYGVDCQDMTIISSSSDIAKLKDIYPKDSNILIQEFIPGDIVSVSLICDGEVAIPISLNKQYAMLDKENQVYLGGELPFDHPLKEKAFSVAKRVIEYVDGIRGFVGVDLILNDDVYLLEINSRFTTPYVGLEKVATFNIGKTIIKLLDNEIAIDSIEKEIKFDNKVVFKKKGNDLEIRILEKV